MDEERVISPWPNIVSMSRLGAVPLILVFYLLWFDGFDFPESWAWWAVLTVFGIGMATDVLDGYLARRLDSVTVFGRMIDPLIDKILIQSMLILMAASPWTSALIPSWAVVLILAREVLITGFRGYAEVQDIDFSASPLGKGKTASQTIAILMIFGGFAVHGASMADMVYADICFWMMMLATFLTVASGGEYVVRLRNALNQEPESQSI